MRGPPSRTPPHLQWTNRSAASAGYGGQAPDRCRLTSEHCLWNSGTGARGADGKITEYVTGDLWYPHVYMTSQDPYSPDGANAFGRLVDTAKSALTAG